MDLLSSAPRLLIVYYSRTGTTRAVADGLARASGADLELIQDVARRRGPLGYLRCGYEALRQREVDILPVQRDPARYDIVFIGGPTWADSVSSPVRAYLTRYAATLPRVAFFVTYGGSGAERALEQMEATAGKKPLATLALREHEVRQGVAASIGAFYESVLRAWEQATADATGVRRRHHAQGSIFS